MYGKEYLTAADVIEATEAVEAALEPYTQEVRKKVKENMAPHDTTSSQFAYHMRRRQSPQEYSALMAANQAAASQWGAPLWYGSMGGFWN